MTLDPRLRVLVIGAHPDDCEARAGGTAVLWRRAGCRVRFLSMTDGSRGHHERPPEALAAMRRGEAAAAAAVLDVEHEVLDNADGHLEPTIERRLDLIRRIRAFRPDLVITHRPIDYHPDHRYTAILVQDAAYMVTVPLVAPEVPHLERNPVFAYLEDDFERPAALRPDAIVDVDPVVELKWRAIEAHASQFFEWLPYNQGILDRVPPATDAAGRRRWLEGWVGPSLETAARRFRSRLEERYGAERGARVRYAEVFEVSEYGRRPSADELSRFFPL